jgi:hypothetical protein
VPFLTGLEHEDHIPGQLRPMTAQQHRRADQRRGVQVVPTGMHHPGRGGEGFAGLLGDRQCVHVGPEQHGGGRRRTDTAQHRDDRGQPLTERDLEPEPVQGRGDQRLSPGQLQADLGCAVQVMAQREKAAEQFGRLPRETAGERQILPCDAATPKITISATM